jgi:hypothetical protein
MDRTLTQLNDELGAELATLDLAQTQRRPVGRPDAWTVQQIAEHLMLTYASTAVAMDARLEKGSPTKAKPTLVNRAAQCAVCSLGYFPSGRLAPEPVQPGSTVVPLDGPRLYDALTTALSDMDARLSATEQVLGTGRAVSHFVMGPMSIAQWRRFHLAHGRHHLKQIAGIRRQASV